MDTSEMECQCSQVRLPRRLHSFDTSTYSPTHTLRARSHAHLLRLSEIGVLQHVG